MRQPVRQGQQLLPSEQSGEAHACEHGSIGCMLHQGIQDWRLLLGAKIEQNTGVEAGRSSACFA